MTFGATVTTLAHHGRRVVAKALKDKQLRSLNPCVVSYFGFFSRKGCCLWKVSGMYFHGLLSPENVLFFDPPET